MSNAQAVNEMFGQIATRYDFANHLLSGGFDYYWRYKLVSFVKKHNPSCIVDLATGSGDVAFALKKALGKKTQVIGLDFCRPMLELAQSKKAKYNYGKDLIFDYGDCLELPLADQSVDVLTIAFGFRNLQDRHKGLEEMYRVLKRGGALFILEFTQPIFCFRTLYYFYLKNILPRLANLITGRQDAYNYLADSIKKFPNKETLKIEISKVGFTHIEAYSMTASIVAIHSAIKS